jgi:hypothetical protein
LKHYQLEVWELIKSFVAFNISCVPRSLNRDTDFLANVTSRLILSDGLMFDNFSVEIVYMASIPKNVINWRVFDNYQQIIKLLHLKDTFKYFIIDEGQHEQMVNPDTIDLAQSNIPQGSTNDIPKMY